MDGDIYLQPVDSIIPSFTKMDEPDKQKEASSQWQQVQTRIWKTLNELASVLLNDGHISGDAFQKYTASGELFHIHEGYSKSKRVKL